MGIKFLCPNGHKLHVKTFLSGKKAICPKCGVRVVVPQDGEEQADPGETSVATEQPPLEATLVDDAIESMTLAAPTLGANAAPASRRPASDPIAEAPAAVWYVRPATGGQYGPASGQVMRSWLEQGRVGGTSLVWRDGWSEWRGAADAFPELGAQLSAPSAAHGPQAGLTPNGMPALAANLPLGHVVQGVPEMPPSMNASPSMPPLAQAVRKRRRKNDTRLIFSAILGAVSVILVIVLVLVFRAQNTPSTPPTQEAPAADEGPMN